MCFLAVCGSCVDAIAQKVPEGIVIGLRVTDANDAILQAIEIE